jgi:hypothetical protein
LTADHRAGILRLLNPSRAIPHGESPTRLLPQVALNLVDLAGQRPTIALQVECIEGARHVAGKVAEADIGVRKEVLRARAKHQKARHGRHWSAVLHNQAAVPFKKSHRIIRSNFAPLEFITLKRTYNMLGHQVEIKVGQSRVSNRKAVDAPVHDLRHEM